MKKLMLLAVSAIVALSANAQVQSGNYPCFFSGDRPEKVFTITPTVGLNISTLNVSPSVDGKKSVMGYQLGAIAKFNFVESLGLRTGVLLSSKGFKISNKEIEGTYYWNEEIKGNPIYVEIPVGVEYTAHLTENVALTAHVGPYFAVGIAGKVKENSSEFFDDGNDWNDSYYSDSNSAYSKKSPVKYNRFDMGYQLGIGATFAKHFNVGLAYQYSLTDAAKTTVVYEDDFDDYEVKAKGKTSNFMLTLGYTF